MAIVAKNLKFRYSSSEKYIIYGADIELRPGECVLLTGPNGCGKSTLVSILAGMAPDFTGGELSGEISDQGSVHPACLLQHIDSQLLADTVEQELSFFLKYTSGPGRNRNPRQATETLGISHLLNQRVDSLSSGEKQRLAVACALLCGDNATVILDEPSAFLDESGTNFLLGTITELKKNGSAVLLATHDYHRISATADRYFELNNGRLTETTAPHIRQNVLPAKTTVPDAKTPLLSAKNISYLTRHGEPLINNFSISIPAGSCIGLTGPNGCGKTSAAKTLCGIYETPTGGITFGGAPAVMKDLRKNTRFVAQNPYTGLIYRTAGENIKRAAASDRRFINTDEAINLFGMQELMGKDVSALSYGQAARTAILAAALSGPEVLVIDEACSSLDRNGIEQLAQLAALIKTAGKSVLIISHAEEIASALCDKTETLGKIYETIG